MRGVLAVIWGFVVFFVVTAVVGLCAMLKFAPHSTEGRILQIAGVIIGLGLGINAYRKTAKPPPPPSPPDGA